ncbi:MAG: hypothetical protein RIS69_1561, partial [Actinomycetota bacterium]
MIESRETFCRFCHAACPLEVDIEINTSGAQPKEKVVAVRGIMNDPMFEGYTCIKGRQLADQHNA